MYPLNHEPLDLSRVLTILGLQDQKAAPRLCCFGWDTQGACERNSTNKTLHMTQKGNEYYRARLCSMQERFGTAVERSLPGLSFLTSCFRTLTRTEVMQAGTTCQGLGVTTLQPVHASTAKLYVVAVSG